METWNEKLHKIYNNLNFLEWLNTAPGLNLVSRVLPQEEIYRLSEGDGFPCYIEIRDYGIIPAVVYSSKYCITWNGAKYNNKALPWSSYGVEVRCWSSRPTYALRTSTLWEDKNDN